MSFISDPVPLGIAQGGTGQITKLLAENALSPMSTQGDLAYFDGTNVVRLGPGTAGQFLRSGGAGANPSWESAGGAPFMFLGGKTPVSAAGGYSPANATPFYVVLNVGVLGGDPGTIAPTVASYQVPEASAPLVITRIRMTVVTAGTLGSAEFGSMAIRVNNTTDNPVFAGTLQWNAVQSNYSSLALNIALNTGDFFIVKVTPPTWVTQPTATFYVITAYVSPS